jgi:hypothetical protein
LHEVCFAQEFFHETLHSEFTTTQLAISFQMNVRTVPKYLLREPQDPIPPGRHRALDNMSKSELTALILQAFHKGKAMTKR